MSANLRLGREVLREQLKRGHQMAHQRNNPVYWAPGEQEKLIAKAIADGKVTRCEPFKHQTGALNHWSGNVRDTTLIAIQAQFNESAKRGRS